MNFSIFISLEIAYLIGAIPFSVLIGKFFFGKDVRKFGSGNAGATNSIRVLGKRAGIIVLLLDVAKGMVAVSLSYYFGNISLINEKFILYQFALGLAAAIGHIYPVYLWFKGGKGVATFFGVIVAVFPQIAIVCAFVFFIAFLLTKYVSLSSIIASIAFSLSVLFFYTDLPIQNRLFTIFIPLLIIYTHRENIKRLINKEENKFSFKKNNSNQ